MRKIIVTIVVSVTFMVTAEIPHQYYIGNSEVDPVFWHSIPDSIRKQCASEKWNYDSVVLEILHLPIEYYLDSIEGEKIIKRRTDKDVAIMKERLMRVKQASSETVFRLKLGDTIPNFSVTKNPGGGVVKNIIRSGKCYLINFWATWCGNCLMELLPSEIPHLAEEFIDDKDFVFLPICIDSSLIELKTFFNSEGGKRWKHIEYLTFLDKERKANSLFAESGHLPLTIIVGKDGRIKYLNVGKIHTEKQYEELRESIIMGLRFDNY